MMTELFDKKNISGSLGLGSRNSESLTPLAESLQLGCLQEMMPRSEHVDGVCVVAVHARIRARHLEGGLVLVAPSQFLHSPDKPLPDRVGVVVVVSVDLA